MRHFTASSSGMNCGCVFCTSLNSVWQSGRSHCNSSSTCVAVTACFLNTVCSVTSRNLELYGRMCCCSTKQKIIISQWAFVEHFDESFKNSAFPFCLLWLHYIAVVIPASRHVTCFNCGHSIANQCCWGIASPFEYAWELLLIVLTLRRWETLNCSWGYDSICKGSIRDTFRTFRAFSRVSTGLLRHL